MEEKRQEAYVCFENLDRKSPDLWPEKLPGVWDFNKQLKMVAPAGKKGKFRTDLDADDIRLVNELGQLSADQLMEHVKNLQNSAYQLGIDEAKQLARGKFLKIFEQPSQW